MITKSQIYRASIDLIPILVLASIDISVGIDTIDIRIDPPTSS